ncbi:MAG: motility associated factor glycosyltransferase family protein, partial [Desulfobulbaceae bacterium]|nr:motility associated factor glycosyltransferase family protein [Desulfobulbaceae bacterium]
MPPDLPDFYESNLALLAKNHPHIWKLLTDPLPEPEGEIVAAPNGCPNLWTHDQEGNRISLHIPEDPQSEVAQFVGMVDENFSGVVTLTGMGLGYAPLALIQQRRNLRHLAIFEPSAGIFLQAMHAQDLAPLLSDPRTILGIGPELNVGAVMSPAIKALQLESIHNLQHLPSFSLNFAEYKQLHQAICDHCSSFNIEGNTLNFMGRDFLENRLRHLNSMHHNRFLAELAGKFKNIPAIIVSAGPSLDKNVHLLAQAKGKAVIIATDSALPAMVANEIMPDFLGTIDPLELIFEKVAGVASKVQGVSLLCMSWVSSKMAKLFPADQIFWGFGGKPIEAWISHLFGNRMLTAGAGSVAHLNLISAIIMKCSPIVFIGQDLSFSPSKSHSNNTVLQTNDLVSALLDNKDDIVWLDGIDGGKVLSNRGMHGHKRFLEMVIKEEQGHYINATEGGCHIEGTEVMPLQHALNQYCIEDIGIAELIHPSTASSNQQEVRKHLLSEFRKITRKGVSLSKMLDKTDHLSRTLLQWLDKAKKGGKTYRFFDALPVSIR